MAVWVSGLNMRGYEMSAIGGRRSRILRDGYEHIRNPQASDESDYRAALEERLRAIRERDNFPTLSESLANLWKTMKGIWKAPSHVSTYEKSKASAASSSASGSSRRP